MGELLAALGGAVAALLVVALVSALRRRNRRAADLEAMLAASQREVDDLRARLDELTLARESVVPGRRATADADVPAFLITDAGSLPADDVVEPVAVPDRLVLTATLGAPLVKVAAFSHGVRRALRPETRNRIWFEMRREVRASRKRRKRLVREYLRETRAEERAREGLA
jgi:hypothetical protein